MGGHAKARYNLGCLDGNNGRLLEALNHFRIAAKLGNDDALESLRGLGIRKEIFDDTLRGHQAAVDATKSKQRDEAYASGFYDWRDE